MARKFKVSFINFASEASYVRLRTSKIIWIFSSKINIIFWQKNSHFWKSERYRRDGTCWTPCIVCNFHDFYYCKYNGNEITLLCCSSIFYDLTSTFWQLIYSSDLPGTLTSIINVKSFLHPLKLKFRAKVFVVGCH